MQNSESPKKETSQKSSNKLTYEDIEDIVEYLVRAKARDNVFDCWDADDIAQEIRIICLKALDSFEPEKAMDRKTIINYFGTCVDTRLKNVKRDNYIRFNPPFSKARVREIEENPEENAEDFQRLQNFKHGIEEQKKIKHASPIDNIGESSIKGHSDLDRIVVANDMEQYLIDSIDESLRPALMNLLKGDKRKVNIRVRRRIQASIRTILEQ